MLQRLRIKFVALSMGLLLLVLALIMALVNLLNYHTVCTDADRLLAMLSDNGGSFSENPDPHQKMSPELPYESRYFSVQFDASGNVTLTDTGKIKAIDTSKAISYATLVVNSGKAQGFLSSYRYLVKEQETGSIVVFLDCTRSLSSARSFLAISITISAVGYLLVGILLFLLSSRVVKPIAESYEKQRRFITDASHDLKTPITIIDADASVLEMDLGENEWLMDIQKQTRRLADLTNDLVLLSRMEETDRALAMIEFPLSDLVSETASPYEALAISKGKSLVLDIAPMISYTGNEEALRKLLSLLLDNAMTYSLEQGTIRLSLKQEEHAVMLTVSNPCETISDSDVRHLFDRFYRTDQSRNSATGGHGIGLSVAKAIVLAHHGTITASTPDGQSLTFTIRLPFHG